MKDISRNVGVITVALIAISVGATLAVTQGTYLQSLGVPSPGASGAFIGGHVEAIVRDDAGNIIAYRQADNAIVKHGMALILDQLFAECIAPCGGTTNNHTNITDGRLNFMQIGNGTTAAVPANAYNLTCPISQSDGVICGINAAGPLSPGCDRVRAEIGNASAGIKANGAAQINITAVATFTGANCESKEIREAGIFNNADGDRDPTGQMFARNTFGSVDLTNTDSLELTWRFSFTDTIP